MNLLDEKTIFSSTDEHGKVTVKDSGEYRWLVFGEKTIQGAALRRDFSKASMQYIRLLLIALTFTQTPASALNLGLGTGAIVQFFHKYFKQTKLRSIELRKLVLDICEKYFDFPDYKNSEVVITNAFNYLQNPEKNNWDYIVIDLFLEEASTGEQSPRDFISRLFEISSDVGTVSFNLWKNTEHYELSLKAIKEIFPKVLVLPTNLANEIVVAQKEKSFDGFQFEEYQKKKELFNFTFENALFKEMIESYISENTSIQFD